jgi:hypothetical protein
MTFRSSSSRSIDSVWEIQRERRRKVRAFGCATTVVVRGIVWLPAFALLALASASETFAGVVPPEIVVRIHDMYGVPAAERSRAQAVAATILLEGGVGLVWRDCSTLAVIVDECHVPVRPTELIVRLTGSPKGHAGEALAYSIVDTEQRRGTLATVFTNRVHALAALAATDRGTLLGRTIAHEITHLLLGTTAHASAGLMRARWDAADVRRNHPADWSIRPPEATELRRHAQARHRATPSMVLAGVIDDRSSPPRHVPVARH